MYYSLIEDILKDADDYWTDLALGKHLKSLPPKQTQQNPSGTATTRSHGS